MEPSNTTNYWQRLFQQGQPSPRDGRSPNLPGMKGSRFARFDAWFRIDPRALALFRITYGLLLIVNILRRLPYITLMYSRDGVLPNKVISASPFSSDVFTVLTSFDGVIETQVFFYFALICAVLFTLGWKTRLFQFLSAACLFSIHTKNILVENGGDQVMCIFMAWSLFLPLGKRWSMDALRESMDSTAEATVAALNGRSEPAHLHKPLFNLVVFAVLCQLAVIYFFNTVSKHGPTWRDGTALYYILHMDRQITEFAVWCRTRIPYGLTVLLTYGTLVVEGLAAPLIMSPIGVTWCRRIAVVSLIGLHLGIAAWMNVGLFSWAMICAYPLLLSRQDFELGANFLSRLKGESLTVTLRENSALHMRIGALLKRFDRLGKLRFESGQSWSIEGSKGHLKGLRGIGGILGKLPFAYSTLTGLAGLALIPAFVLFDGELSALMGFENQRLTPYMDWPYYIACLVVLYAVIRFFFLFEHPWLVDLFRALSSDRKMEPPSHARGTNPMDAQRLKRLGFILAQCVAIALMLIASRQMFATNDYFKDTFDERPKQYSFASKMLRYPRMFNKWNMFAPNPPKGEGWIIIDGCTMDGRNIDPQTGQLPHFAPVSFDRGVDWGQMWRIYTKRIAKKSHRKRRPAMRDWLKSLHRTNPEYSDMRLKEFDVYWMRTSSLSPNQWYKPLPRDHWVFSLSRALGTTFGSTRPCRDDETSCTPTPVYPEWVRSFERTMASWMRSEPMVASGLDEDIYDANPKLKPRRSCHKVTSHHPKGGKRMSCKTGEGKSVVPKVCLETKKDTKKRDKAKRGKKGQTGIPKARPARPERSNSSNDILSRIRQGQTEKAEKKERKRILNNPALLRPRALPSRPTTRPTRPATPR